MGKHVDFRVTSTNLVHSKKNCEIIPVPYVDFVPSVVPFRRFCKPKNILDSLVVPYVKKCMSDINYTQYIDGGIGIAPPNVGGLRLEFTGDLTNIRPNYL